MKVNTRNALGWGFNRPIGPPGLEGWPPYLYNLGAEQDAWDEGLEVSNGELRKEDDHLRLIALGPMAEYSYVRTAKIDFTDIDTIYIDWMNDGNTSGQNRSALCIGGLATDDRNTYEKKIQRSEDFARTEDSLDVTNLTGEHLVRLHVTGGDSFSEIPGRLSVYKLWVEYGDPPDAEFERFWMDVGDNSDNINLADDQDGVIDHDAGTISMWYPSGSDISEVIFRWDVPSYGGDDYVVTEGGVVATSGVTKFDFTATNPRTFIVMQEPGTTNFKEYVVTMWN